MMFIPVLFLNFSCILMLVFRPQPLIIIRLQDQINQRHIYVIIRARSAETRNSVSA